MSRFMAVSNTGAFESFFDALRDATDAERPALVFLGEQSVSGCRLEMSSSAVSKCAGGHQVSTPSYTHVRGLPHHRSVLPSLLGGGGGLLPPAAEHPAIRVGSSDAV